MATVEERYNERMRRKLGLTNRVDPEYETSAWGLSISPTKYLEMYPKGPNAELARRILDRE